MSAASWFRRLRSHLLSRRQSPRPSPRTRPTRSCLHLEQLEDRVVPDAAAPNFLGGVNNPTFQFGAASTFLNVSQHNLSGLDNSQRDTLNIIGSGPGIYDQFFLGVGAFATNSFGAMSSVNSLGTSNPLVPSFAPEAFGFGSGTQPGAPWAPAAYNVGLANRQFAYPSIADQGFQTTPPWALNTAFHIFHDDGHKPVDNPEDVNPSLQPVDQTLTQEGTDDKLPWDTGSEEEQDGEESVVAPKPMGAEVVRADGLRDRLAPDVLRTADGSPVDPAYPEILNVSHAWRRGDPEVEEYLFGGHLQRHLSDEASHDSSHTALVTLGENPLLATLEGTSDEWHTVEERLTESPLLLGAVLGLISVPVHSQAETEDEEDDDRESES